MKGDVRFGISLSPQSFRLEIAAPVSTVDAAAAKTNAENWPLDFRLRKTIFMTKLADGGKISVWQFNDASLPAIHQNSRTARIAKANRFMQHLVDLNDAPEDGKSHTVRSYGPADGEIAVETFQAVPALEDRRRVLEVVSSYAGVMASNLRMGGRSVKEEAKTLLLAGMSFDEEDGFVMKLGDGAELRTADYDPAAGTIALQGAGLRTGAQAVVALTASVALTQAEELASRAFLMRAA